MTIKDHPHPGLILSRFLARRYITVGDLCTQMDIQSSHIESVLHGRRRIGALFAHRLCQAIGGEATDMDETAKALRQCSAKPFTPDRFNA